MKPFVCRTKLEYFLIKTMRGGKRELLSKSQILPGTLHFIRPLCQLGDKRKLRQNIRYYYHWMSLFSRLRNKYSQQSLKRDQKMIPKSIYWWFSGENNNNNSFLSNTRKKNKLRVGSSKNNILCWVTYPVRN